MVSVQSKRNNVNFVKKVHRYIHVNANEMGQLLSDAGVLTEDPKNACDKIYDAHTICLSSGKPKHKKKISLYHINESFNEEVKADFTIAYVIGNKRTILNIIEVGTNYGKRCIVESRSARSMMKNFKNMWIYHHGAPKKFCADSKFCRPLLKDFLAGNRIKLNTRPSRSSNKSGKMEGNNGKFKNIMKKYKEIRRHMR